MTNSILKQSAYCGGAILIGLSPVALGQQSVLEEIIVTAQKKTESIQDVPITITAFDSDSLDFLNVTAIDDLAQFTPGLNIAQGDPARMSVRIRGIGSIKFDVGSEGSVGIFIDEIYMPRFSGIDFGLSDIERVEVLKGPQGTLFGRNTTGGAISIVSASPTQEAEGYIDAEVSNRDSYLVRGAISGGITDNLSLRLAAGQQVVGGFVENTLTGTTNDQESQTARLSLRYEPSDDLRISGSVEYTSVDADVIIGSLAILPGGFTFPLLSPPTGPFPFTPTPVTEDPYTEPNNFDGQLETESFLSVFRLEKDFENLTFVSLTGYRDSELDQSEDFDHTRLNVGQTIIEEESDTFSQEFRLSAENWIFGVYYYVDDAYRADNYGWKSDSLPYLLAGGTELVSSPIVDVKTTSWALFGQYSFAVTDNLSLVLGARYSEDEKDFTLSGETSFPGVPTVPVPFAYDDKKTWDSFDPKISLDYNVSEDALVYFSYSQGYKSGGVQFSAGFEALARQIFDPEELDAYEIGIKSDLLEGRMRLNSAVYYYDYTNLQQQRIEQFGPTAASVTRNAGESEIKGVELDLQWIPVDSLNLRLAYSYLDAEFSEFIGTGGQDFAGNRVPNSPEHTVSVAADYQLQLPGDWSLLMGTDWFWTDEYNFDVVDDDPLTKQDQYTIGNVRLALQSPGSQWQFLVYVENVTDEEFYYNLVRRAAEVLEIPSDKRRYGFRVNYSF